MVFQGYERIDRGPLQRFGISPEGIGAIGMVVNFVVTIAVSSVTPPPPASVQAEVEALQRPSVDPLVTLEDH